MTFHLALRVLEVRRLVRIVVRLMLHGRYRFNWTEVIALLSMLTLAYLFVFLSQLGGIR